MWQKQEAYWEAEKEARNELMRDVLISIQQQVFTYHKFDRRESQFVIVIFLKPYINYRLGNETQEYKNDIYK